MFRFSFPVSNSGYSDINPYDEPNNAELTIETGNHKSIQEVDRQLSNYIVREIFT